LAYRDYDAMLGRRMCSLHGDPTSAGKLHVSCTEMSRHMGFPFGMCNHICILMILEHCQMSYNYFSPNYKGNAVENEQHLNKATSLTNSDR
jgi:hypothetical protein